MNLNPWFLGGKLGVILGILKNHAESMFFSKFKQI
jgi:hypothetical protein